MINIWALGKKPTQNKSLQLTARVHRAEKVCNLTNRRPVI
jgi:hypothetical protein